MKRLLPSSLFARLALVLLLVMTLLGSALLLVSRYMSEYYSQALLQRLNQPVADYITHQQPLLDAQGQVNEQALDQLASHAMILNPALEIYLLDPDGNILGHRLPTDQVQRQQIGLEAIQRYLQPDARYPIVGDDPGNPAQGNIFSVAPIQDATTGARTGYVYAVIGGQHYRQLRDSTEEHYALTIGSLLIISGVLIAIGVGLIAFFAMTRRLSRLRQAMREYDLLHPQLTALQRLPVIKPRRADEIDQLAAAFRDMAAHIHQQFTRLQTLDQSRRELIANVSHDLRTPLAAIQGYIETALLQAEAGDDHTALATHLRVSIRQCRRLSQLIEELFELSRLQSDATQPDPEPFSLLELAHDCVQEFQLKANQKAIQLAVRGEPHDSLVTADIAMIQRVLQNLLDNALRHTETGGSVSLQISRVANGTRISVSDTGCGISHHDIPFIFDRYFQARGTTRNGSHGLGLAIVQRILELHQTRIEVESELNRGTRFSFVL